MSHVTTELTCCTIGSGTAEGRIVVLERWQYNWLVDRDAPYAGQLPKSGNHPDAQRGSIERPEQPRGASHDRDFGFVGAFVPNP